MAGYETLGSCRLVAKRGKSRTPRAAARILAKAKRRKAAKQKRKANK
jgi:hypothetical protein